MSEEEVSKACDTILRDLEQKSRQAEVSFSLVMPI